MPELPQAQREALAQNVKAPLVYTKVLVRNWQPWVRLGVHEISAPMSFHTPRQARLSGQPRRLSPPARSVRADVPASRPRAGRARPWMRARSSVFGPLKLLSMEFAEFEARIRDELDRMLGPGGFSAARDIAAITVNRWSHGYSYAANSLFDDRVIDESVMEAARATIGRVAIANSDAQWDAYAHSRDRPGGARGARTGELI